MNFPASPDSWESETASFISTLKEVFEGERRDDIHRYAEKAWMQCGLAEGKTWDDVRTRVHDAWHQKD